MNEQTNRLARDAALAAVAALTPQPTSLIRYESRGVVAIIGAAEGLKAAMAMPDNLQVHLLLDDDSHAGGLRCTRIHQRNIQLKGYLGNFVIELTDGSTAERETVKADLVLDLGEAPLLDMPLPPPGYLHVEDDLQAAIDELAGLVGTFEKPKYFDYDPSICAHGRSGKTVCTRCIDACPADAIVSLGEIIEVEGHLCQGGGVCATACPSGAIRYVYPSADDMLTSLRCLLRVYREEGGQQPVVVFHAGTEAMPASCPANLLPIAVEELASVGIEVWLSVLAYGAGAVLLLDDGNIPDRVTRELDTQVTIAGEILAGMGYPSTAVRRIDASGLERYSRPVMSLAAPAVHAGAGNKRRTAFMAIDALYEQALARESGELGSMVPLTVGAPFGTAVIDSDSCTLCLSCVSACPGKALQSGQDTPQVRFIESNCLQCGTCILTCPEDAIGLSTRLVFDAEERSRVRVLHEEPPFCCVSCGKPFATRSVIDAMLERLEGHWMFSNERARQRLMMCEDCRVIDVVQDPDMMEQDVGRTGITH